MNTTTTQRRLDRWRSTRIGSSLGRSRRNTPAFVLPLVMMVGFFAVGALAVMVQRQSGARLSAARQINGYQQHHLQAGLRQLLAAWSSLNRVNEERRSSRGVIGFDIVVEGAFASGRMEVRLREAQGTLRHHTVDLDPDVNDVLSLAAERLSSAGADTSRFFRDRGAGQVSLDSAPPEVLMAIASAVSGDASSKAFAEAVVQLRTERRLTAGDIRNLTIATGLPDEQLRLLEQCIVVEPTLWQVLATTRTGTGSVVDRQAGLIVGVIRGSASGAAPSTVPGAAAAPGSAAAAAAATTATGNLPQANNWVFLQWANIDEAEALKVEAAMAADRVNSETSGAAASAATSDSKSSGKGAAGSRSSDSGGGTSKGK